MRQKACSCCKVVKPLCEFHSTGYRHSKAGKVKMYKPDCRVCANKKWEQRINERLNMFVSEWKCCICGYDRCQAALDFHHVDRTKKDFAVSARRSISVKKLREEIEKCILVCANCHREIHAGMTSMMGP